MENLILEQNELKLDIILCSEEDNINFIKAVPMTMPSIYNLDMTQACSGLEIPKPKIIDLSVFLLI